MERFNEIFALPFQSGLRQDKLYNDEWDKLSVVSNLESILHFQNEWIELLLPVLSFKYIDLVIHTQFIYNDSRWFHFTSTRLLKFDE